MNESVYQTRCSAVVRLTDAVTGKPPAPSLIRFETAGYFRQQPIMKPGGLWVFTDLPAGEQEWIIASPIYAKSKITFDPAQLNRLEPLLNIRLLPGRAYPIPYGTTGISLKMVDSGSLPLPNQLLLAGWSSCEGERTRLAKPAAKEARTLELARTGTGLAAGDRFTLFDPSSGIKELIRLHDVGGGKEAALEHPLTQGFSRGTLLLPLIEGVSGTDGETILLFQEPVPKGPGMLTVNLMHEDGRLIREETISAGVLNRIEDLSLKPD